MNVQTERNPGTDVQARTQCPSCGGKGKHVSPVTVRALLKSEYRDSVPAEMLGSCEAEAGKCSAPKEKSPWRFCDSPECDIVYFNINEPTTFSKSQVSVEVGVKEKTGERPLCYCFGHSVASIKNELRTKGRSDALEDIRRKMKDPGCRCEVTNPSGSCCLGAVAKGVELAKKELGLSGSETRPTPNTAQSRRKWGERVAKIGTVLSAIIASSCCWLPLVLLAIGVSGVGIAATLEAYRPVFIVVTFGFLAAAFYFTYRPRKAVAEGPHACCSSQAADGSEAICASKNRRRFNMIAVNKVMLWAVTVLAVAFLLFPQYVGFLLGSAGGDSAAISTDMIRTTIRIEGMTCEGCTATVAKAIGSVPGVLAVQVDYESGKAVIGTEPGRPVPIESILARLKQAGYTARIIDSPPSEDKNRPKATADPAKGSEPAANEAKHQERNASLRQAKLDARRTVILQVAGFA